MNAFIETNHGHEPIPTGNLFVCCLVDSEWQALNIVDLFRTAGFSKTEISLLFPNRWSRPPAANPDDEEQALPEPGIAPGVLAGALGWLAGFSALQMPPLGSLLAAGPIMEELSDWNQPSLCDVTVRLRTFGIVESRAHYYTERLAGGEILIATHSAELHRARQTERILSRWGAKDIDSAGSSRSSSEPQRAHETVR
jgi:hypothetical protein